MGRGSSCRLVSTSRHWTSPTAAPTRRPPSPAWGSSSGARRPAGRGARPGRGPGL